MFDNVISNKRDWSHNVHHLLQHDTPSPFDEFGQYKNITRDLPDTVPATVSNPRCIAAEVKEITNRYSQDKHGMGFLYHDMPELYEMASDDDDSDSEDESTDTHDSHTKTKSVGRPKIIVKRAERHIHQNTYEGLKDKFLYAPKETVEQTLSHTTQYGKKVLSGPGIKQTLHTVNPATNVLRRKEAVATDQIFSDTPAIDTGGIQSAQMFIGRETFVGDVYGVKTSGQFVNTLQDNIRQRGAMDKLISDSARVEISQQVKDILRAMVIQDWQSEPYYHHQNFFERE